jgi:hypothetical protein
MVFLKMISEFNIGLTDLTKKKAFLSESPDSRISMLL